MARGRTSDIPVGTQFSPDLIDLPSFLAAIVAHSGSKEGIQTAVFRPPVHLKRTSVPDSRRTASLPLEAAVQYGLLTPRTYEATQLAVDLGNLDASEVYIAFARHILLNLHGLEVLEAIEQMDADYRDGLTPISVSGDTLAAYLSQHGVRVGEHNTAINTLRMWLAQVGLFPNRGGKTNLWVVDSKVKAALIGIDEPLQRALSTFDERQTAFVLALCKVNPEGWVRASSIRDHAELTSERRVRFNRGSLPKQVLEPLKNAGLVEYRTGGTSGGKTAMVRTTPAFNRAVLEPFLERETKGLDPTTTAYYRQRPADIYAELESPNAHLKGFALEAFAIHIMRLLGLRLVGWRKRAASATGQAEVDALMAGMFGGVATTWQVQCKNTRNGVADVEDVAKEVGIAVLTGATHILFVTTGRFSADARVFAASVTDAGSLTLYLLDGEDFAQIRADPTILPRLIADLSEGILKRRLRRPAWT